LSARNWAFARVLWSAIFRVGHEAFRPILSTSLTALTIEATAGTSQELAVSRLFIATARIPLVRPRRDIFSTIENYREAKKKWTRWKP
jgi:hypothetical protein